MTCGWERLQVKYLRTWDPPRCQPEDVPVVVRWGIPLCLYHRESLDAHCFSLAEGYPWVA